MLSFILYRGVALSQEDSAKKLPPAFGRRRWMKNVQKPDKSVPMIARLRQRATQVRVQLLDTAF